MKLETSSLQTWGKLRFILRLDAAPLRYNYFYEGKEENEF